MIACKTTIGFGAPTKAGKSRSHGSPLGAEEIKGAREKLGWSDAPFEIPADMLTHGAPPASARRPRARPGTSGSRRCPPTSAPSSSAACAATCRARSTPRSAR